MSAKVASNQPTRRSVPARPAKISSVRSPKIPPCSCWRPVCSPSFTPWSTGWSVSATVAGVVSGPAMAAITSTNSWAVTEDRSNSTSSEVVVAVAATTPGILVNRSTSAVLVDSSSSAVPVSNQRRWP